MFRELGVSSTLDEGTVEGRTLGLCELQLASCSQVISSKEILSFLIDPYIPGSSKSSIAHGSGCPWGRSDEGTIGRNEFPTAVLGLETPLQLMFLILLPFACSGGWEEPVLFLWPALKYMLDILC